MSLRSPLNTVLNKICKAVSVVEMSSHFTPVLSRSQLHTLESEFNRQDLLSSLGQVRNYVNGDRRNYYSMNGSETDSIVMPCNDDEMCFKQNANTVDATARKSAS